MVVAGILHYVEGAGAVVCIVCFAGGSARGEVSTTVIHFRVSRRGKRASGVRHAPTQIHFSPKVWNRNVERAPGKSGLPLKDAEPYS